MIFNVNQCFIPNSNLATVTFPNFDVDWANFSTLSKYAFKVIITL